MELTPEELKDLVESSVENAIDKKLGGFFVEAEAHYQDHMSFRDLFGDKDRRLEFQNNMAFISKVVSGVDYTSKKVGMVIVAGVIALIIYLLSNGAISVIGKYLAVPIGFIKRENHR